MTQWPVHAEIAGPIVMIGFGSIGKGALPLIERHFTYDKSRFVVIDPEDKDRRMLDDRGIRFIHEAVTQDNYRELLAPLLTKGAGQGFCVNLSVDTSSVDIMELCGELGALYIDTVNEPWPGFYFNTKLGPEKRSNYALREITQAAKRRRKPGSTTAVSCCGANPGMVSWFVKQALLNIAADTRLKVKEPQSREDWAKLARKLGVKGIHIAERDTQRAKYPKPQNVFVNTWSVEGFVSEGLQPAELGFGTHEKWMPANARKHKTGCQAAIYLLQPGANTRVRSWTPTAGGQYGFLVTHNEAISISDFFTLKSGRKTVYRPTCHYAYHPCNDAVLSLHEMFGAAGARQEKVHILDENEIADGIDELGVLVYGHKKKRLLVRLAALDRRDPRPCALPERHRPAGDERGARRHGLGTGKSPCRHRRGRRDGFPPLPRRADALSRPSDRQVHRLDAARRPSGLLPRRHRQTRSLAVQERARALTRRHLHTC
ncbi:MAG: homospermidine synthase [Alphaproteobacteria bacterium]|nr:MAG: homospermidine synthase [Alphaproteobacteria bacterium]